VRLKGSPPDKSLGTDAATGLVIESPEAIFAGTAAFAAGGRFAPREKPKPSHRASEPMDAAVLQVVTNLLTRAPATSALEEQKQSEELISFLKEIHEARQNRPAMPSEGKSVQERKRQRSKKR